MQGLEKVIHVLGGVATVLIVAIMIFTTGDVIARYILNSPLKGVYEISEILFLSAVLLGLSYTQLYREHVRVDLLIEHFSPHTNLVLETCMLLLAFFIYGLFAWRGWGAFLKSFDSGEFRWGLIPIPLWPARLMIPIGAFALCLRFIGEILVNIGKLFNKKGGG